MKNQKKNAIFSFAFVCVSIILVLSVILDSKRVDPKDILDGNYYDYKSFSNYTFQLEDLKFEVHDVDVLSQGEYYQFLDHPVSFPMYLKWNDDSKIATLTDEVVEEGPRYYLFRDGNNNYLLIPEKQRVFLIEWRRPFAFYLRAKTS